MPTISISRDYSTSKNLKMYLIHAIDVDYSDSMKEDGFLPYEVTTKNNQTFHPRYLINRVPNLQEIPDLSAGEGSGSSTDTIEITTLADAYHEYANGLKNRGDSEGDNALAFTFLYDKNCYAGLQYAMDIQKTAYETYSHQTRTEPNNLWKYSYVAIVLPDDSYFLMNFKGMNTVFRGVGINSALTYQLNISLNSNIEWKTGWSELKFVSKAGELIADGKDTSSIKWLSRSSESADWASIHK